MYFFCLQTRRHEIIPTLWHMCATYSQYELRNWEDGKEEMEEHDLGSRARAHDKGIAGLAQSMRKFTFAKSINC